MPPLPPALSPLTLVPSAPRPTASLKNRLLDLLFPPRCAGCGRAGKLLCLGCQAQVHPVPRPVCIRCGQPVAAPGRCDRCAAGQFHVSALRAAAVYAQPLSRVIHQFKYEGRPELHEPLGQLLAGYWRDHSATVDLVTAVPLHENRLRARGFNQSDLLATVLCRQVGLPLLQPGMLCRARDTEQQMLLKPAERRANVQDAFRWAGPPLDGSKVLLIDDVATTGSTLEACAAVLLAAGAGKVWALTVARALSSQA
ncbi:MAG TPA: ComF family protein [Anaerolineae bacterium]|nr:ComF family protein [Anaerolineae bacterium]